METDSLPFFIGAACLVSSALMFLVPALKRVAYPYLLTALGAAFFFYGGFGLAMGAHAVSGGSYALSTLFEFRFSLDALSGLFVLFVSLLTFAVSIYSIGYSRHLGARGEAGFFFNLFVLSLYAVLFSANMVTFLIAWESMSVFSYFLVVLDKDAGSARAGLVYAVMTHVGTAFLMAAFFILYSVSGSMEFSAMRASLDSMGEALKGTVFVFFLVGFGMKAGIVPLHTWLPRAHPAAPSNVSAMMSGVMIKMGVYGFIRFGLDVLGTGPEWWGIAIVAVGAVSSVLGVLYALMEHDIKRLLAYHSVENIGIIYLGLGASMVFSSSGLHALSALALAAALYHTLNHALFKGLLFLGAGGVVSATGTKDVERMGGLIKLMPYTAFMFLVGSIAICALPPFNGFVSEWLTFQALLLGFNNQSFTAKVVSPLGGAALALTGALAAACFVKAFGIMFLGSARSEEARAAREASTSMIVGMAVLALMCLATGIFPGVVVLVLSETVFGLTGSHLPSLGAGVLGVDQTAATLSPLAILLTTAILGGVVIGTLAALGGRKKTSIADSWDCGMKALTPRMQYTATAFSNPVKLIFRRIYQPRRELKVSYLIKPFFVESIRYKASITPFAEKYLYAPLLYAVQRLARSITVLQSGSLNLYLGYMLITLVLLLVFAI